MVKNLLSYEYAIGFIFAFTQWGYNLYRTASISHEVAGKSKNIKIDNYNFDGLQDSLFGFKRVCCIFI